MNRIKSATVAMLLASFVAALPAPLLAQGRDRDRRDRYEDRWDRKDDRRDHRDDRRDDRREWREDRAEARAEARRDYWDASRYYRQDNRR